MKNYGDLGGCYLPQPTTSTCSISIILHKILLKPHSLIVNKHFSTYVNGKQHFHKDNHIITLFTGVKRIVRKK